MPDSRKSKRPARCSYSESGRRCTRNGTGSPALCSVHRVVFQDMGRPQNANAILDVFGDLLAGERVSTDRLREAASELLGGAWGMGGGMAGGYYPDVEGSPSGDGVRFKPPPGFPGWNKQPPPEDPFHREQSAARVRARQVLGFAASEPITKDQLRKRHRDLAKRHHPDRGGSVEKMQEVNAAVDVLMGWL